jgi:polyhydroxybutyrate depolymerase
MKGNFCRIYFFLMCIYGGSAISQKDSLIHQGRNRTFTIHKPEKWTSGKKWPLVLALHGGFGSAENLANQSQLNLSSNENGFVVIYPEGWANVLGIRTWNAGWCCGPAATNQIDDIGFIEKLMDRAIHTLAIDSNRIYVTGMSNGGFMAYRLACESAHRIAAIAPVAASMSLYDCRPLQPVSIIHFNSYQDESIPYQGGVGNGVSDHYNRPLDSVMAQWAVHNEVMGTKKLVDSNRGYTHYKYPMGACNSDIEWYLTRDGGHSWPGGRQTPVGDPVSTALNANQLMWDFFKKHVRICQPLPTTNTEAFQPQISIYPNPSAGEITIQSKGPSVLSIRVLDFQGKLIHQVTQPVNLVRFQIPGRRPGWYLLEIQTTIGSFHRRLLLQ